MRTVLNQTRDRPGVTPPHRKMVEMKGRTNFFQGKLRHGPRGTFQESVSVIKLGGSKNNGVKFEKAQINSMLILATITPLLFIGTKMNRNYKWDHIFVHKY